MNRTHVEHVLIALAFQVPIGVFTGNWWAGAAFGAAIFFGREHAQAEIRYVKANGGNRYLTPNSPEIGCLHPRYWNLDSVLDCTLPALAVALLAWIIERGT